jgi:hypothetical protein
MPPVFIDVRQVLDDLGVKPGDFWTRDRRDFGREPVHLPQMVDRPVGQGRSVSRRRSDGDEAVVGAFEFFECGVKATERPADLFVRWGSGDAEDGKPVGQGGPSVELGGGSGRDVEEASVLDPQLFEKRVNSADAELGEIGDPRAKMRRRDGGQAEDSPFPGGIGDELAGVEPSHAVADQVDGFVREGFEDLFAELLRSTDHAGRGVNPRHQHAVSRRLEDSWDPSEVPGERQRTQANPAKAEQTVSEDNRGLKPGAIRSGDCRGDDGGPHGWCSSKLS